MQVRLRNSKHGILLKFPYCSFCWFSTCRSGDSVPKFLESNAAACLAEFKLILLLTPVLVISSNFCNHSARKLTVTGRGKEYFSVPLYVFIQEHIQISSVCYTSSRSLLPKLEFPTGLEKKVVIFISVTVQYNTDCHKKMFC